MLLDSLLKSSKSSLRSDWLLELFSSNDEVITRLLLVLLPLTTAEGEGANGAGAAAVCMTPLFMLDFDSELLDELLDETELVKELRLASIALSC